MNPFIKIANNNDFVLTTLMANHWILTEEATSVVRAGVHSFSKCFHLISLHFHLHPPCPRKFLNPRALVNPSPHFFFFIRGGPSSFLSVPFYYTLWNPFVIVRIPFHLKPMFKAQFTFHCFRNLILPQPLQVLLP